MDFWGRWCRVAMVVVEEVESIGYAVVMVADYEGCG
jgi:hypothetical protein